MHLQFTTTLLLTFCFLVSLKAQDPKTAYEREELSRKYRNQAGKLWKDEQYQQSEKLILEAIRLHPLNEPPILSDLAEMKIKIGDINSANKIWQKVLLLLVDKDKYKKMVWDVNDLTGRVYLDMIDKNILYGDAKIAVDKYLELTSAIIEGKVKVAAVSSDEWSLKVIKTAYGLRDVERLAALLKNVQLLQKRMRLSTFYAEVFLKILHRKFDEAIQQSEAFENKLVSKSFLAEIYAHQGNPTRSEEFLKAAEKNIVVSARFHSSIYGLNALSRKEFDKAIQFFSEAIKPRVISWSSGSKLFYYVKRAEAWEGLKEFEKARFDYEAALIHHSEYEPALSGLARLESIIITERRTDKTAPQLIITEPQLSSLNKADVMGNELLIKGNVTDPGGIKLVTINGENAYFQAGGLFWGNALLKEGLNKVSIRVTDHSGNFSEKVIEVIATIESSEKSIPKIKQGKNYALLIGCQNYEDSKIPSLEDPIPDAVKLKLLLKNNYNFGDDNLYTLFNPVLADFKKLFLEIHEVIQPEDNLVIFYAGHGVWVENEKKGYWMLTDARHDDPNTWLPNKIVLDLIAKIPARHTLLITDACFSGSVFRSRGFELRNKESGSSTVEQRLSEKISRVAITSGNDTEVPDKSVFMKYLIKALGENKEKYLTAQKMFVNHIIEAVMAETRTEPRYGTLELAGHVGGDFIFIRK